MKDLILNNELTMSSREIAELAGKEVKHVHRDIKMQLFEGLYGLKDGPDLDHHKIQGFTIVLDRRGYWGEVLLNRYHSDILVSGYEVKYRAAIVKRWHELEAAQFKTPKTFAEALRLAQKSRCNPALKNGDDNLFYRLRAYSLGCLR
jgi:phage regulator Rha-like protein